MSFQLNIVKSEDHELSGHFFRDGGHVSQYSGQIVLLILYKILRFEKNPCVPTDLTRWRKLRVAAPHRG